MNTPTLPLAQRVQSALVTLANVAEAAGMKSVALELTEERIPALVDGRLSMVVLGEFNHGKSTAINALLGTSILPTGITPTTAVITHVVHGSGKPRIVTESGRQKIDREALKALLTTDAPNDLRYVEIQVESDFLKNGVYIVDTPGVNDISRQKVEITYGYVPRADVVVYVLDATQALKKSEVTFIQDRLLRASQRRLFFLLGKIDALSDDELTEVREHVETRIRQLVGPAPIFPVSARRALTGDDPGFEAFRTELTSYLGSARDEILVESAIRTGERIASIAHQSINIERSALRLGTDELEKRIQKVKVKLEGSRVMVGQNLDLITDRTAKIRASSTDKVQRFAREFATALPHEIEKASIDDIKRYLPSFVHDTFKDWLEKEGGFIAIQLEALAEEIIEITNQSMMEVLREVQEELGVEARSINLDVDTFGYDVGVFALGALGVGFIAFSNMLVGGALTLAAPVLAFVLKDRVDDTVRQKAQAQGIFAIERAAEKVDQEFGQSIDEFSGRLRQFVEDTGERIYRQIAESLDRVVAERKVHAGNAVPVAAELETHAIAIEACRKELRELREEHETNRAGSEAAL
jgi:small GTP-binding protein